MFPVRLFEGKALARALRDAGYAVSDRTVQRWTSGESTPKPQDIRAIRELLGTTKEAAPPEWAERLLEKMDAISASQRIVTDEAVDKAIAILAPASQLELAGALNERLEELLRLRASDTPAENAGADQGEAGPQVPRAE